jgi:hypothetical protein
MMEQRFSVDPRLQDKIASLTVTGDDERVCGFTRISGNVREVVDLLRREGVEMEGVMSEVHQGWDFVSFGPTSVLLLARLIKMNIAGLEYIGLSDSEQIKPRRRQE